MVKTLEAVGRTQRRSQLNLGTSWKRVFKFYLERKYGICIEEMKGLFQTVGKHMLLIAEG